MYKIVYYLNMCYNVTRYCQLSHWLN